jgi:hypothetical protein
MAGAGYKLFNTGDVLTAAQVNTYLNEQTVMVFADSAARTTALSGVLSEGMMSYLQDTDSVEVYDGSAWTAVGGGGASPLTTKGDLYTFSTVDARLGVGANGTVLTADSAETTGLKWAAPAAAGGMTLINTGGTALTGATTTISVIPSGYKKLELHIVEYQPATDGAYLSIRFNADSNTRYAENVNTGAITGSFNATQIYISDGTKNSDGDGFIRTEILGYDNTSTFTIVQTLGFNRYTSSATNWGVRFASGAYNQLTAVTSIVFQTSGGNLTSGTAYLYGVN